MKIAISAEGKELTDRLDSRFGRAKVFIIFDTETGAASHVDNKQNLESAQGAGIQSAATVIDAGAEAVITGNVGPKAYAALNSANVKIFLINEGTVKDAIAAYKDGRLKAADNANVEGHW